MENQEESVNFLAQILKTTYDSDANPNVVYPLLQLNLDKLNEDFAQILKKWAIHSLPKMLASDSSYWGWSLISFATLLIDFPMGNRASNIEIAIAASEGALLVYEENTINWAGVHSGLGRAYRNRIYGDSRQNLKKAIDFYHNALAFYTKQKNSLLPQWADVQMNLGVAYAHLLDGDRKKNLEQAIKCLDTASIVYSNELKLPEKWAHSQYNLGRFYDDLISICDNVQERAENWEMQIEHYNNALQIITEFNNPQQWAHAQWQLGKAYGYRIKGNSAENLKMAIACHNNALRFFNREEYPEQWASLQNNLSRILKR